MKLFSEKVEPTFTDSNINILGVRNFKEIFVDVFEFEINGKKFIAEKVSEHNGMPVINIPVVFKSNEYIAPFALRRGAIEILFNEDNAIFVKPVLEGVHELLEQHSENEKEEIYSFIKNTVEETANKLSSDIENKTKYVESLVNEKIINLTTNTIPNIFLKNMKGSDDSNLVDIRERLESIGTEIGDVKAEKESICTDLKALAEETSHLSENVDKKINNTLSRVGSIKAALENSIESAVGDLNKKIEDVETNIERYYSEKITNVSNEVHELTEQNKQDLIELIESSKQSILEEISLIKNNVPNIVIEKANGKQEIDLKGIKTELEKIIGTKFSTEIAALRRIIEMSSGGGSVAKQFANGGTMDGNLTVVGTISAQSYAGIPNPDLTQYLPISGGTVTGNLTVNGTLSTTLLEALSANITVIDIKQYELSGFNVTGNATVQGNISATGDLTVHKRLNFAGDANGANNLYFVRNGNNNWAWESNGVGQIMGIAGNNVTIGQDAYFTRQGITIRNLGETTGATLLGEAPDVLAQRRRTGTASQTSRIYNTYTDANNYQRGIFTWLSGASAFVVGTQSSTTAGVSALSGLVNPIILAPGYNQSLSATAPVILQQTWNNTNNTFTLLSANVTDNASSASSNLLDLQVNGTSKIVAAKDGSIRFGSGGGINLTQYGAAINGNRSGILGDFGSGGTLYLSGPIRFSAVGIDVGGGSDTVFTRDAANTLAQRNSTNAQTFRLYNTYTDASNYERLGIIWSSNTATIRTESAGSGVSRSLILGVGNGGQWFINSAGGHLQTYGSDGIYDIGAPSSNRPRNIYITGHLAASTKSFKIPHQTKSGYLQYGVVESDQHSVFVRGKTSDDTITLPDHWDWLVDEDSVTVQLTPIGKPMSLFVIEQNNKTVKVGGVEGNYNYTIYGTRKDVPDLIVETEE